MKSVMVFRTSVASIVDVEQLTPLLDRLFQSGVRWNFDLEDCEHILRVESEHYGAMPVIGLLKSMGHSCEELDD